MHLGAFATQVQILCRIYALFLAKEQLSSVFLAPSTLFMEEKFSMDQVGWRMIWGWFKSITFILHFISYYNINFTSVLAWVLSCFGCVQFCATLWTATCQDPLSMRFSRQEYWSRLPCHALLQGIFPTQELNPHLLSLPALTGRFFMLSHLGSPHLRSSGIISQRLETPAIEDITLMQSSE